MKKRVEYIDLLRVLAILSVIAIHINAITRDAVISTNKIYYIFLTFMDSLTRAGVPLFFILTGFFIFDKKEYYRTFIIRKLPKLIIPFVLISFAYYIYNIIDNHTTFNFLTFLQDFSNNKICYHLWYMYHIIIIYLFIPYEKKMLDNIEKKDLLRLIVTVFTIGNFFVLLQRLSKRFDFPSFGALALPDLIIYNNYVLLGSYLRKYDIKKKKTFIILGLFSLISMPILDYFYVKDVRNDLMLTATSLPPLFYSIAIYILVKDNYNKLKLNYKVKYLISKISNLTLYIYLVHVMVMNILVKILSAHWIYDRFYEKLLLSLILFVLVFLISFIISIILDLIYSKIEQKIISLERKKLNA